MAAPMKMAELGKSASGFLLFSSKYGNMSKLQARKTLSCLARTRLPLSHSDTLSHHGNIDDLYPRSWLSRNQILVQSLRRQLGSYSKTQISTYANYSVPSRQCSILLGEIVHRDLLKANHCFLHGEPVCRGYRSRRGLDFEPEDEEDGLGDGGRKRAPPSGPTQAEREDNALMLRTTLENAYLSWTRNTYIMTVAGVTMYSQLTVPFAQEAAVVILFAGGVNLLTGTTMYVYHNMTKRRRLLMSGMTSVLLSGLSVFHVMLWIGAIMVYLGYVEEDPEFVEEMRKEEERYRERKKKPTNTKRISDKYD